MSRFFANQSECNQTLCSLKFRPPICSFLRFFKESDGILWKIKVKIWIKAQKSRINGRNFYFCFGWGGADSMVLPKPGRNQGTVKQTYRWTVYNVFMQYLLVDWQHKPQHTHISYTPLRTKVSPLKALLKMNLLFQRWEMLVSWRVSYIIFFSPQEIISNDFTNCLCRCAHCLADDAPDLTGLTGVREPWDMGILCANFTKCWLPQMNSCNYLLVGAFVESVFVKGF